MHLFHLLMHKPERQEITLADLYHLPYASMLPFTGSDILDRKPNVARWYKDISSRPSWLAVKDGVKSSA